MEEIFVLPKNKTPPEKFKYIIELRVSVGTVPSLENEETSNPLDSSEVDIRGGKTIHYSKKV